MIGIILIIKLNLFFLVVHLSDETIKQDSFLIQLAPAILLLILIGVHILLSKKEKIQSNESDY
jgi:hypothetical protein